MKVRMTFDLCDWTQADEYRVIMSADKMKYSIREFKQECESHPEEYYAQWALESLKKCLKANGLDIDSI